MEFRSRHIAQMARSADLTRQGVTQDTMLSQSLEFQGSLQMEKYIVSVPTELTAEKISDSRSGVIWRKLKACGQTPPEEDKCAEVAFSSPWCRGLSLSTTGGPDCLEKDPPFRLRGRGNASSFLLLGEDGLILHVRSIFPTGWVEAMISPCESTGLVCGHPSKRCISLARSPRR